MTPGSGLSLPKLPRMRLPGVSAPKSLKRFVLSPAVFLGFMLALALIFYFLSIASPPVGKLVYKNPHPITTMGFQKTLEAYRGFLADKTNIFSKTAYGDLDSFQKWVSGILTLLFLSVMTVYFWNKVEKRGLVDGLIRPLVSLGIKIGLLAFAVWGLYRIYAFVVSLPVPK